jgi:hypothetical protein
MAKKSRRAFFHLLALAVIALTALLSLPSCASQDNNDRSLGDMIAHFDERGLKATEIGPLDPTPAGAEAGVYLKISGREIGVYKFNLMRKKQKAKLDHAKERGFIGVLGRKFAEDDFAINGSFVMIDFKANPEREKILDAFNSF